MTLTPITPFDAQSQSDRMLIDALCIVLATQNEIPYPARGSDQALVIKRAREIVYEYGQQAIARIANAQSTLPASDNGERG